MDSLSLRPVGYCKNHNNNVQGKVSSSDQTWRYPHQTQLNNSLTVAAFLSLDYHIQPASRGTPSNPASESTHTRYRTTDSRQLIWLKTNDDLSPSPQTRRHKIHSTTLSALPAHKTNEYIIPQRQNLRVIRRRSLHHHQHPHEKY